MIAASTLPTPDRPLVSLEQVSMQFGSQKVLHAIDLQIQRGVNGLSRRAGPRRAHQNQQSGVDPA